MEGPNEDSLADELSTHVASIMEAAVRDARAHERSLDREREQLMRGARERVRASSEAAARELQNVAAARIGRILELKRELDESGQRLVASLGDGEALRRGLGTLSDALSGCADEIARQAVLPGAAPPPPLPSAASPTERTPSKPPPPAAGHDEAHLYALRRAVAGATRSDLAVEIQGMVGVADDARAVLDDVFGPSRGPFRKWDAARRVSAD